MKINITINGHNFEFTGTRESLETLLSQDKVSFVTKEGTWQEFRKDCESAGFLIAHEELKSSLKGNYYVRDFKCGCHVHHGMGIKGNWRFCPKHNFTDVVLALSEEKINGQWKNDNDGQGDYFVAENGDTYIYAGTCTEGIAWMRCTGEKNISKPLVKSDDLINNN